MPSITQTAAYTSTASASNYNTGSQSIGSSNAGKTIFALIASRGGAASVTACTIGGVAATQVVTTAGAANAVAAIYKLAAASLADPSVTSLAVDVTFNASVTRGVAILIAVTDDVIDATAYDTASGQDTTQNELQQVVDVSLIVPGNGFSLGIGCCYCEVSGSGWSGITQGTEYQVSPTTAETYVRPGYESSMTAETSPPRSIAYSSGTAANVTDVGTTSAASASFAPGAQTITAALYDDSTDTFPALTAGMNIAAALYDDSADAFPAATVSTSGSQTVTMTLFSGASVFPSTTVAVASTVSYEANVISYLLADAPLTALVGNRIFPESMPQGVAMPALVVATVSGAPLYADDGEVGLTQTRMQMACYANTYSAAKAVATAVKSRVSGIRDVTQGSTTFIYVMVDNELDLREAGESEAEYRFQTVLDVLVWR
jgi:hypothetical protein